MADKSLNHEAMERLSAEIDNFYKQLELKYWGLLPWNAISEKLAVQDLFRYLSRVKKDAIVAHSSKYSRKIDDYNGMSTWYGLFRTFILDKINSTKNVFYSQACSSLGGGIQFEITKAGF